MPSSPPATRQKPSVTDSRRAHRALHDFTDDLRHKLNKAITVARSRQLGAARHVEQVIRGLLSRDSVDGRNGMAIDVDLEVGLKCIGTKEFAERGEASSNAIHALQQYEGVAFPRKPLRVGARRKAASSPADEREAELVKSLTVEVSRLLQLFQAATLRRD